MVPTCSFSMIILSNIFSLFIRLDWSLNKAWKFRILRNFLETKFYLRYIGEVLLVASLQIHYFQLLQSEIKTSVIISNFQWIIQSFILSCPLLSWWMFWLVFWPTVQIACSVDIDTITLVWSDNTWLHALCREEETKHFLRHLDNKNIIPYKLYLQLYLFLKGQDSEGLVGFCVWFPYLLKIAAIYINQIINCTNPLLR